MKLIGSLWSISAMLQLLLRLLLFACVHEIGLRLKVVARWLAFMTARRLLLSSLLSEIVILIGIIMTTLRAWRLRIRYKNLVLLQGICCSRIAWFRKQGRHFFVVVLGLEIPRVHANWLAGWVVLVKLASTPISKQFSDQYASSSLPFIGVLRLSLALYPLKPIPLLRRHFRRTRTNYGAGFDTGGCWGRGGVHRAA